MATRDGASCSDDASSYFSARRGSMTVTQMTLCCELQHLALSLVVQ